METFILVTTPPVRLAVAIAPEPPVEENVTAGGLVYPLPPPTTLTAVIIPPTTVVVATGRGVVILIEPVPVVAPIVFP